MDYEPHDYAYNERTRILSYDSHLADVAIARNLIGFASIENAFADLFHQLPERSITPVADRVLFNNQLVIRSDADLIRFTDFNVAYVQR